MNRSMVYDTSRVTNLSKTPGMQRIREYFSLGPLGSEEVMDAGDFAESVEVLVKQTWNIWGVSSLYGLQQESQVHLKLYGKKMREEVAAILPHEDVTYEAQFSIIEGMDKRPSASDPVPIKITVHATPMERGIHDEQTRKPERNDKCIYIGIMLSWRTAVNELEYEKSVRLPLLLCRGTKSAMKAVHMTLANMFDCHVVALPATEDDLKWLVPVLLQPSHKDDPPQKGEARLEYRVPGLPVTDSITIKFEVAELIKMWSVISRDDANDSNEETSFRAQHIEKFYQVLNKQMIHSAGLQLGLCKLHKISLPSFTIMDNKMKASSAQVLSKVLLFFNEKALAILHQLNFDTTVSTSAVNL
ncbi:uncharacterized protein LOC107038280 [Diachasma alloeum]|uniref:uncharacterized protein LOC107038280 n=1 Tax=Diachasma alloeum TaxID=454923 RepID=UPI0007381096|nr:uncharacterized protein LOC107038280 [Diachasma alloeum]